MCAALCVVQIVSVLSVGCTKAARPAISLRTVLVEPHLAFRTLQFSVSRGPAGYAQQVATAGQVYAATSSPSTPASPGSPAAATSTSAPALKQSGGARRLQGGPAAGSGGHADSGLAPLEHTSRRLLVAATKCVNPQVCSPCCALLMTSQLAPLPVSFGATPLPAQLTISLFAPQRDTNYDSGDIKSVVGKEITGPTSCCHWCENTPGCGAYTWNTNPSQYGTQGGKYAGTCWLKKAGKYNVKENQPGHYSAMVYDVTDYDFCNSQGGTADERQNQRIFGGERCVGVHMHVVGGEMRLCFTTTRAASCAGWRP